MFRVRFAPSLSGYLHVGNLRTLVACRDLADSLGGELVVRLDDGLQVIEEEERACLMEHMRASLEACGIRFSEVYVWSEWAKGALRLLADECTPRGIRSVFRHPVHIYHQEIISLAMDTLTGVTHCVRGEDLARVAETESWICDCFPGLRRVETRFVPLLTYRGKPISKSRAGTGPEPETTVLRAVDRFGAEALVTALHESLSTGVNEWEKISMRLQEALVE